MLLIYRHFSCGCGGGEEGGEDTDGREEEGWMDAGIQRQSGSEE